MAELVGGDVGEHFLATWLASPFAWVKKRQAAASSMGRRQEWGDLAALTGVCKALVEADEQAMADGRIRVLDTAFVADTPTASQRSRILRKSLTRRAESVAPLSPIEFDAIRLTAASLPHAYREWVVADPEHPAARALIVDAWRAGKRFRAEP